MTLKDILISGQITVSGGTSPTGEIEITENGTYDVTDYASADVNVAGGGEPDLDSVDLKDVVFIDYDGQVVYNYTAQEFLAMNAMPANPSHSGLVAQGWNWSLADARQYVEENGMLLVGQMYATSDGATRIYFSVDEWREGAQIAIGLTTSVRGGVTIDWGDGTTNVTDGNANTRKEYYHTYDTAGDYVVKITAQDGTYIPGGTGGSQPFIGGGGAAFFPSAEILRQRLTRIEIGDNVTELGRQMFDSISMLKAVTIPKTVVSCGHSSLFGSNPRLSAITLPEGFTIPYGTLADSCAMLRFVSLPKSAPMKISGGMSTLLRMLTVPSYSSLSDRVGNYNYNLEKLAIPGTYTSIATRTLQSASNIKKITIPATVDSIAAYALAPMGNIKEYHFKATTPATLAAGNNTALSINEGTKIYVPYSADHSVLNAYKTATNWSNFASYIEEEPE